MNFLKAVEQVPSPFRSNDQRYFVFCNQMFLFSFFGHIIFVPVFYNLGNDVVFINNIIAIFIDVIALRLNYKGFIKLAPAMWISSISLHSSYCIFVFGWGHGFDYYLLSLIIFVFFSRWRILLRLLVTILFCAATILMFLYAYVYPPITQLHHHAAFYIHAFNAIANFAGIAYASFYYRKYSEQIEGQLLRLANTDALTGILNRRSFEKFAANRLADDVAGGALLLLDIDHFKKINDSFGHAAGDVALQRVTEVCKRSLRDEDLFGRIGGEEFAIFLTGVHATKAVEVAESIRKDMEASEIFINEAVRIDVRVSIGVAVSRTRNTSLSDMMIRSDQALYQAKNSGKNRVVAIL